MGNHAVRHRTTVDSSCAHPAMRTGASRAVQATRCLALALVLSACGGPMVPADVRGLDAVDAALASDTSTSDTIAIDSTVMNDVAVDAGAPDVAIADDAFDCATVTTCSACTAASGCAWCGSAHACLSTADSDHGACSFGLAQTPPACMNVESMRVGCSAHGDCMSCTYDIACGWCSASHSCVAGTAAGPANCVGDWHWVPSTCSPDSHATRRESCAFTAGAATRDTLDGVDPAYAAVYHVIVIMEENHSFDNMFGASRARPRARTFPGLYDQPGFVWPSPFVQSGVSPFRQPGACPTDPAGTPYHQRPNMLGSWDNGLMDGFVTYAGHYSMEYLTDDMHPVYTWLAQTFASSDAYFGSVLGGTWGNRPFLYCGTSNGVTSTGNPPNPRPCAPTIFDEMTAHSVSWEYAVYHTTPGDPWDYMEATLGWNANSPGVVPFATFMQQLASGTGLPEIVFLDAGDSWDEHPSHSTWYGEKFLHDVVAGLIGSSYWASSVLFVTYDESGGYFDHVPPPSACPPGALGDDPTVFNRLGFRVPVVAVSPFSLRNYNSSITHSHTSILRFIEVAYNLPALTARDANSDAMLDLFDFRNSPNRFVPPWSVPDPGPDPHCM